MKISRYIKLITITLILALLATGLGCKDKPNNSTPKFSYPLAVGNRWSYSGELIFFNIRPDSVESLYADTIDFSSIVEITRQDTLFDTLDTYVFHETLQGLDAVYHTDSYFANKSDGFYAYGSSGINDRVTPLKIHPRRRLFYRGQYYNSTREIFESLAGRISPLGKPTADTIDFEDPPIKSLQYPLKVGAQWLARDDIDWPINKEIVAWEKINLPAGQFSCYQISWHGPDEETEFFDHVSAKGLVARSVLVRDIAITDYASPDTLALFDAQEDWVLTGLQVE